MGDKKRIVIWSLLALVVLAGALMGASYLMNNNSQPVDAPQASTNPENLIAAFKKASKMTFPDILSEEDSSILPDKFNTLFFADAKEIRITSAQYDDGSQGFIMRYTFSGPMDTSYKKLVGDAKQIAPLVYGARAEKAGLADFSDDSYSIRIELKSTDVGTLNVSILIKIAK